MTTNQTIFEKATLDQALGLTGANLTAARLKGATFKGTDLSRAALPPIIDGADFTGATLTGVKLQNIQMKRTILDGAIGLAGADLSQVAFTDASLRKVNLSGAKLFGASFNSADLEGSNLSGAFLTRDPAHENSKAATLQGAHLKNVNLSKAQLSGANFTNGSFYGTVPAALSTCQIGNDGFTKNCATATGATLNGAQFSGAYLYGADFTNTTIVGVEFGNSVLTGANFAGATLSTGPLGGRKLGFSSASCKARTSLPQRSAEPLSRERFSISVRKATTSICAWTIRTLRSPMPLRPGRSACSLTTVTPQPSPSRTLRSPVPTDRPRERMAAARRPAITRGGPV